MAYQGPTAANLAQAGRNEDNALLGGEVAHISRAEADLLRSRGGAGTINPVTGLPEYQSAVGPAGPASTSAIGYGGAAGQSGGQSGGNGGPGASTGAGYYGGPLPPGITGVMGLRGVYSGHPGETQRLPGRTIADKIRNYQKKKARESQLQFEAKINQQAAIEQRLRGTPPPPLSQGIGTLSPGPTTDASTFQADAQQLSTSFGIPLQQAIISLAKSRGLDPDQYLNTTDANTFLADAQQLSTSSGIPIQQAIISLASSRGLDPNQFLNVASVGIGSIAPASTTPPLTAPAPTGGFFPKNVILDAITGSGVLPST